MRVGFGFSSVTFRPSRISVPTFSVAMHSVDTDEQSTEARILPNIQNWQILRADNVFVRFYFSTF